MIKKIMIVRDDIPYGHRLMITLGYIEWSLALILYPISLIGLAYSEGSIEANGISMILYVVFYPLMIFYGFDTLNKLRRKDLQGLANVKTLMLITLILWAIGLIETIYLQEFVTIFFYLFSLPFTIFTLIYWGAPSHKIYFESFLKF